MYKNTKMAAHCAVHHRLKGMAYKTINGIVLKNALRYLFQEFHFVSSLLFL